jgi:hypothetical protein
MDTEDDQEIVGQLQESTSMTDLSPEDGRSIIIDLLLRKVLDQTLELDQTLGEIHLSMMSRDVTSAEKETTLMLNAMH